MTNLNVTPYNDDFDPAKNFHQILMKPGISVQAREITQLQSILRDQIAKFGSHVFKHGSVVIPGNSNSDLNVCYVKLLTPSFSLSSVEGSYVTSTTGLRAFIKKVNTSTNTLYVSYVNNGTAGQTVFGSSETLTVNGSTVTTTASGTTGYASMAFVNQGVFFVNGTFVQVNKQSLVIGENSTPSCHVLLQISESIVTSDIDSTLLDPSQGSNNFNAPGADRLKISLTLTTLPLGSVLSQDYIELMRFDNGVLLEHLRYPKYNELEKSLARRTYDESGDYVVSGLNITTREHLKSTVNGGRYENGDKNKLIYTVSAGKAYIRGFENEVFSDRELVVNKTRDASHIVTKSVNMVPSFGQYFYVTGLTSLPNFIGRESVNLYSYSSGTLVGTAKVLGLDYFDGATSTYKLYVADVNLAVSSVTHSITEVGSVKFTSDTKYYNIVHKLNIIPSSSTDFTGDISIVGGDAYTHGNTQSYSRTEGLLFIKKTNAYHIPYVGDVISTTGGASGKVISVITLQKNDSDSLIVPLPVTYANSIKNDAGVYDITYKINYQTKLTNNGSFTVSGMTIDTLDTGNTIIIGSIGSSIGVVALSHASLNPDGTTMTLSGFDPSTDIYVLCTCTKTGIYGSPKKKVQTDATQVFSSITDIMVLDQYDGVRLVSVISTVDGDVTDRYTFDNGQRDYAYTKCSIIRKSDKAIPSGTLTISYQYFEHTLSGYGTDFFSIDSYVDSGLVDYYQSPLLVYTSKNTGTSFNLINALDFRCNENETTSYVPTVDSRIHTSVQKFVGRYDSVVLDKDNTLSVISGIPAETPRIPKVPSQSLHLANIFLPPYVYSILDVVVNKQSNRVYTMKDVGGLDSRISRIEEFVTLTATEASTINYEIVDAKTGLTRFKSGYMIDSFTNPDTISDINNPYFKVVYNSGVITPQFEVIETPLTVDTGTSTVSITDTDITLPRNNDAILAQQPLSSKVTNVNPFSVFSWVGSLNLIPNSDSWEEVENLPQIINNNSESVNITQPWSWSPVGNSSFISPSLSVNDGGNFGGFGGDVGTGDSGSDSSGDSGGMGGGESA